MELSEAKSLIRGGENDKVEFKRKANHPEKIIKEIVAFANTSGGYLFIGIGDDRTIAGLKYPEEEEFVLTKAITELCRPRIDFEVQHLTFEEGINVLLYIINEGRAKPYYAFLEKRHRYGKAFVRVADKSIQASYEMRKILKERETSKDIISLEENTLQLFKYFETKPFITISEYRQLTGLNKKLASNKLVSLALSGALKIEPREGEDLFIPV